MQHGLMQSPVNSLPSARQIQHRDFQSRFNPRSVRKVKSSSLPPMLRLSALDEEDDSGDDGADIPTICFSMVKPLIRTCSIIGDMFLPSDGEHTSVVAESVDSKVAHTLLPTAAVLDDAKHACTEHLHHCAIPRREGAILHVHAARFVDSAAFVVIQPFNVSSGVPFLGQSIEETLLLVRPPSLRPHGIDFFLGVIALWYGIPSFLFVGSPFLIKSFDYAPHVVGRTSLLGIDSLCHLLPEFHCLSFSFRRMSAMMMIMMVMTTMMMIMMVMVTTT